MTVSQEGDRHQLQHVSLADDGPLHIDQQLLGCLLDVGVAHGQRFSSVTIGAKPSRRSILETAITRSASDAVTGS